MVKGKTIFFIFLFAIILIAILFLFGFLQKAFVPAEEKLTQYAVTNRNNPELVGIIKGRGEGWNRLDNTDYWINTVLSKEVVINSGKNEFKFVITSLSIIQNQLCTQIVNVYKNNILIDTFEKYDTNYASKTRFEEEIFYDDDSQDSYIIFKVDKQPYFTGCEYAINTYSLKLSDDSFNFHIWTLTTTFIKGQTVIVNMEINNKLTQTYMTNVELKFEAATIFGLFDKTIAKENVLLNPGKNTVELSFTPKASIGKIDITPKLILKAGGNNFNGLNFGDANTIYFSYNNPSGPLEHVLQCSPTHPPGECKWIGDAKKSITSTDWIPIGSIEGDKTIISVSPNPLYLELGEGDTCPTGYVLSEDEIYCIRDDIKDLGCNILGCPTIEGHEYICTSSGICAETIFVDKSCLNDSMCPSGTVCDVNSGLCITTQIFKEVIQCEIDVDCIIPCNGMTASCVENKCIYKGKCINIEFGCKDVGCPEGYVCDKDSNICKTKGIRLGIIPIILITVVGALFIFIIYLIIKKFKRKKR